MYHLLDVSQFEQELACTDDHVAHYRELMEKLSSSRYMEVSIRREGPIYRVGDYVDSCTDEGFILVVLIDILSPPPRAYLAYLASCRPQLGGACGLLRAIKDIGLSCPTLIVPLVPLHT